MLQRNFDAVLRGFEPLVAKVPQKIPERDPDIFAVEAPKLLGPPTSSVPARTTRTTVGLAQRS